MGVDSSQEVVEHGSEGNSVGLEARRVDSDAIAREILAGGPEQQRAREDILKRLGDTGEPPAHTTTKTEDGQPHSQSDEADLTGTREALKALAGEVKPTLTEKQQAILEALRAKDKLSDEERSELFDDAVGAMRELAEKYGVTLPENLQARIILLDEKTFTDTVIEETGAHDFEGENSYGITLNKTGVILLNETAISKLAEERRIDKKDLYRQFGVHEMWHTSDNPLWAPQSYESREYIEEVGKVIPQLAARTDFIPAFHTLIEGFTDYRTIETLKQLGQQVRYITYPGEVEVISELGRYIDLSVLFSAASSVEAIPQLLDEFKKGDEPKAKRGAFGSLLHYLTFDKLNFTDYGFPSRYRNSPEYQDSLTYLRWFGDIKSDNAAV